MDDLLELADRAQASHFWYQGFRRFVVPVLDEAAGGRPNLRLLDCACGRGHNLSLLSRYGHALGFDIADRSLSLVKREGWPVTLADACHMPFLPGSIDIATSFDVLQCVQHDRRVVQQMAEALRPGGTLVATLAAFEMLRGDHSLVWEEYQRYTPASARQLMEGAGLEVVRLSFLFASLFPIMLTVRTVQRLLRPFRTVRRDADIRVPSPVVNTTLAALVKTEAAVARYVPMPIGSSLLVVAKKR